ncbi:MAG: branched-chain amino acid ABC transporter substrate-binding protein [Alphaproteobacteria bacterium]
MSAHFGLGWGAGVAFLSLATFGIAGAAETQGPVTDEIGVIRIAKGDPIAIGFMAVLSGPDAPLGIDEQRGVEILVQDLGGKLLDHPIRLVVEDGQCTAEGGQAAATRLVDAKVATVIGPTCSSEAKAAAPVLWRAGITSIGVSPTAPSLTDAKREASFGGFARVCWNDGWAGNTVAEWARKVLGAKKAVAIHDGSPYAQSYAQTFLERFKALGGTSSAVEASASPDVDLKPLLSKIAGERPDLIFYPVFTGAAATITKQAASVPGLEKTALVASEGALAPDFLKLAGDAATKVNLAIGDTSPAVLGKGYPEFVKKYKAKYGSAPVAGFHHFAYDAGLLASEAIRKVAVTDKDGNLYIGRKALRDAIFATKGLQGLSGIKNCDKNGDCGIYHFAVVRYTNAGEPFQLGKNPAKIYP